MGKIYWLASYPKSGNTWIRILLTNYLRDTQEPVDISKRLEGGPIASSRVWFDEWAGIEASALPDAVIEKLRPEVYRCMARAETGPIYMKTHDAWKQTDKPEPLFPADISGGAVYIVRNPLDMAASLANHYGIDIDQAVQNLCDPDYANARSVGGITDQLHQYLGSWSHHVRSWLDQSGLPLLTIRYEDLLAGTQETFEKVIRFLGLDLNDERLCLSVKNAAFSELQQQEMKKGFPERPRKSSHFFRQGRAGGWRSELSPGQVEQLVTAHREFMHRFAYLDDRFEPL